jgi:hypothetical protein
MQLRVYPMTLRRDAQARTSSTMSRWVVAVHLVCAAATAAAAQ